MRSVVPTGSPSARTPRRKRSTSSTFITNADNQRTWAKNSGLPVNKEANDAVTDPNMKAVLDGLNNATFTQLFLDQFFSAEVGGAVNDQTALLFAGETSPEDAAAAITAVAGG